KGVIFHFCRGRKGVIFHFCRGRKGVIFHFCRGRKGVIFHFCKNPISRLPAFPPPAVWRRQKRGHLSFLQESDKSTAGVPAPRRLAGVPAGVAVQWLGTSGTVRRSSVRPFRSRRKYP